MNLRIVFACSLFCIAGTGNVDPILAQPSRPHPLTELRTLNDYFPFVPPPNLDEWQRRRESLRRHIQISLGLWPMPEKTPLNPVVHGRIDMGDYTIDKVFFESFPGFLVTGNLYRPKKSDGSRPGVLCPHGHFRDGRFRWANDQELARELETGAEQFETNGRSPLQARCANLAMLGCVVFHYDMLGYADSQQITHGLAHGFRKQRPAMNQKDSWGLFSPRAELRLQSVMGLQTWNSIRALDFLCALPDVDDSRIGVTGGSGGGTQTFMLCAIDPRPAVAFPAVMVSTAMQGGCTCENCCNLRVHAGNVDFAALFAPKPIGLTAADDWTKEMETKGFPELSQLYKVYADAGFEIPQPELTARLDFPHNYNQVSREAMYTFFNRHLELGHETVREKEIQTLPASRLTVFDDEHPAPSWGDDHEKELLRHWNHSCRLFNDPGDLTYGNQLDRFHSTVSAAVKSIISHPRSKVKLNKAMSYQVNLAGSELSINRGTIRATESGLDTLACICRKNVDVAPNTVVLRIGHRPLTTKTEKSLLENESNEMIAMLQRGDVLVETDLVAEGHEASVQGSRLVPNGREAAGYTFGYNRSLFAWRVSQVLDAIQYLEREFPGVSILIEAKESRLSPVAAMAFAATDSNRVTELRCHLDGFRFAGVDSMEQENFLPGGARYGDIPGFLATKYRRRITLTGESEQSAALLRQVMNARGYGHQLELRPMNRGDE